MLTYITFVYLQVLICPMCFICLRKAIRRRSSSLCPWRTSRMQVVYSKGFNPCRWEISRWGQKARSRVYRLTGFKQMSYQQLVDVERVLLEQNPSALDKAKVSILIVYYIAYWLSNTDVPAEHIWGMQEGMGAAIIAVGGLFVSVRGWISKSVLQYLYILWILTYVGQTCYGPAVCSTCLRVLDSMPIV